MNGVGEGQYVLGLIHNLYNLNTKVGPTTGTTFYVNLIHIDDNIAIGSCVIRNWHSKDFVNFYQLIKENGEWKIITKSYQQI